MKKIFLVLGLVLLFSQTAHAEWGSVTAVDDGLYDSTHPKVSFNSSGQGALVWKEDSDVSGDNTLYVSLYQSGSWAVPQNIATVGSSEYEIVINEDGSVFLVWTNADDVDSTYSLYTKVYNGSAWLSSYLVNSGSDEYSFKILPGTVSQSFLIWQQYGAELYLSTYDGSSWSSVENIILDYTKVYFQNASINSSGKIVVTVSLDSVSSGHVSPHAIVFDGSSWSDPYLLSTKTPENYDYSIENNINDDGNIWVSWEQENSRERNLYFSSYSTDDDAWDLASQLNTHWVYYSDLDLNNDESGIISWVEYEFVSGSFDPSNSLIYYLTYQDGAWSDPDFISTVCEIDNNVNISINESGEILAVWICDAFYVVSRFYDGSQWLDEENLGACVGEYECDLQVAFNDDGEAVVTWVGEDSDHTARVYTAVYTSTNGGSTGTSGTGSTGGTSGGSGGSTGSGSGSGSTTGSLGGTDGGNLTESEAVASGCSFNSKVF